MLSQRTFIKLIGWKGWIPKDSGLRLFSFKGIKYYLTFEEHESFQCLCNRKNRDKILKIKEDLT